MIQVYRYVLCTCYGVLYGGYGVLGVMGGLWCVRCYGGLYGVYGVLGVMGYWVMVCCYGGYMGFMVC